MPMIESDVLLAHTLPPILLNWEKKEIEVDTQNLIKLRTHVQRDDAFKLAQQTNARRSS